MVNARNANCLTGLKGYNSLKEIAEETAKLLTHKQKLDEDNPKKVTSKEIIFGCTGTIGEPFPLTKIKSSIKSLVDKEGWTPKKLLDSAFPAFESVGQDLGATVTVFPYEPF